MEKLLKSEEQSPEMQRVLEEFKNQIGSNYELYKKELSESDFDDLAKEQKLSVNKKLQLKAALRLDGFFSRPLKEVGLEIKTIFTHQLPQLGPRNGSSSGASKSSKEKHPPAQLIEKPFEIQQLNITSREQSPIWVLHANSPSQFDYKTESDIQLRVSLVIQEVITSLGYKEYLSTTQELSIFRLRADIWIVVTKTGTPIGLVEVKKPHKGKDNVMDDPLVHGQIFDYLLRLNSFHGLIDCFGVISTYEEWRIVWLPGAEEVASGKRPKSNPILEYNYEEVDELKSANEVCEPPEGTEFPVSSRQLQGSKIYKWNDKELPFVLAAVIDKMYHGRIQPVLRIDPKRPYIRMTEKGWMWWTSNFKNFHLDYSSMPTKAAKDFILLEDLRGGVDGRVWLACSTTGKVGVIKFSQLKDTEEAKEALKIEKQNWIRIYKSTFPDAEKTRVICLGGDYALLMPYLKKVFYNKPKLDNETKAAVEAAIEEMAALNLCHTDLHWRHVGIRSPKVKGEKKRVIFFDLSGIQDVPSTQAAQNMKSQLFGD